MAFQSVWLIKLSDILILANFTFLISQMPIYVSHHNAKNHNDWGILFLNDAPKNGLIMDGVQKSI